MDDAESSLQPCSPEILTREMKSAKQLAQGALDANKKLQFALTQRAEQLEIELKEADNLLVSAFSENNEAY
jgi:hypothetical protein